MSEGPWRGRDADLWGWCVQAVEEEEKRRAQQKAAEQEVKQGNNYEKRKSLVESFGKD